MVRAGFKRLKELPEAQRSRRPFSGQAVRDQWRLVARVHVPYPLRELRVGSCGAGVLSQVLRPGADTHFRPERARTLKYFIDTVKKSSVAQENEPELFRKGKKLFPVFWSNNDLRRDRDRSILGPWF